MEENKENTEFLNKLALITDAAENMFRGKMSIVFQCLKKHMTLRKNNLKLIYQELILFSFWMSRRFTI